MQQSLLHNLPDIRNPHRKARKHTDYYKVSSIYLNTIYHSLEQTKAYAFYTILRHQYKQTDIHDYKTKYHAICKITGIRSINTVKKYIGIIVEKNWAEIKTGKKSKRTHLKLFSTKKIAERNKIKTHKIFSIPKSKVKNQKAMEDWFTFLMVNNNKDRQYHNAYEKLDLTSIGKKFRVVKGEKIKVRAASIRTLLDRYSRKLPSKKAINTETYQSQKQLGKVFHRSAATVNLRLKRAEESKMLVQDRKKLIRLHYSPIRPTRDYMDELGAKHKGYVYHCDKAIWLKKASSYLAGKEIEFEKSPMDEKKYTDKLNAMKGEIVNQFIKWYRGTLIYNDQGQVEGVRPFFMQSDFVDKTKTHSRYIKPVNDKDKKAAASRISKFIQALDKKVLIQDNLTF